MRSTIAILCGLLAVACGSSAVASPPTSATSTPSASPVAAGGRCTGPSEVAIRGANDPVLGLYGLGATIVNFESEHGLAQPLDNTTGGPLEDQAVCSASGVVTLVKTTLSQPRPADGIESEPIQVGFGALAPPDSILQSTVTTNQCKQLFYRSAELAAVAAANDPNGTFVEELTTPTTVVLLYTLDTKDNCKSLPTAP